MEKDKNFRIEFYRKENGGIYTAYNLALSHEKHQLNVCGIAGLDADPEINIFGGKFSAIQTVPLLIINKVLCIIDYQNDGISANLFCQYENHR